ncbi:Uncharacterised protein [Pragia fontium]|uniref:hypothetical protein n=1 Tax=Pragia fontium TaxID=82985 RepID=UPI000E03FBBE|nr:hypothetical protein [Pragia fontium]SUB81867.1 Uncharacterised protein [Pragia fontium]
MNNSSSIISTSDDAAIQQQFIQLSHSLKHNLPITLLHIGQEKHGCYPEAHNDYLLFNG